ncbi:MAG: nuclear transport factor 2 family protein [Microbacterium pygmaeum]
MDRSAADAAARRWIEGYLRAWGSNDPDDIRVLFTDDASYRFEPWTAAIIGPDEIVRHWLERRDDAGSYRFEWDVAAIDGDLVFVEGVTTYDRGVTYSNLWVIRLDDAGHRARSFTEWFMDQSNPS